MDLAEEEEIHAFFKHVVVVHKARIPHIYLAIFRYAALSSIDDANT